MSTARIDVDERRWPLIVVTFPRAVTDDQFREYLEHVSDITRRAERARRRTALTLDASGAGPTPATQRRLQADWLVQNRTAVRDHCAGLAFVIRDTVVRGVMTAVFWFQAPAAPSIVCATRDEGLAWCRARLADPGARVLHRST